MTATSPKVFFKVVQSSNFTASLNVMAKYRAGVSYGTDLILAAFFK